MNLLDIRKWFVRESGRYDLVLDDVLWEDSGADAYINAGQRMLDRLVDITTAQHTYADSCTVGDMVFPVPECRSIKEVLVWTDDEVPVMLAKSFDNPLLFSKTAHDSSGRPTKYLPTNNRDARDKVYTALLLYPIPDNNYYIEVRGYFYSPSLTTPTSESYWTIDHPSLLVMAAQCQLEMFSRNSEGVRDWMESINLLLTGINYDSREQDTTDIGRLGG